MRAIMGFNRDRPFGSENNGDRPWRPHRIRRGDTRRRLLPGGGGKRRLRLRFSEAVSRLEARLGVPLLNRTTRSITPTEAGARLLDRLAPAMSRQAEPKSSGRKVLLPIEIGHQPGLLRLPRAMCQATIVAARYVQGRSTKISGSRAGDSLERLSLPTIHSTTDRTYPSSQARH